MTMEKPALLSVLCVMCLATLVGMLSAVPMWEVIKEIPDVRWMARILEGHKLSNLFEEDNITVFLPTSDAYFRFQYEATHTFHIDYDNPSHLSKLLRYSSVRGRYLMADLPYASTARLPSRLDPNLPLYVNNLNTHIGQITTINGARFIKTNLVCDNGIIHVMNRVIAPVAHHSTLATYVESPALHQFAFTSIYYARAVVPNLTMETNKTQRLFTSFSPNDSYITVMPDYGQVPLFQNWTLLRIVYMAHVIEDDAIFLPEGAVVNNHESLHGTLKFSRHHQHLYVSNGRVRARVIQPNIPVVNGVLHVIDNLLYYVYRDVIQMMSSLPNTRRMSDLLQRLSESVRSQLTDTDSDVTIFVPSDLAFAKLPSSLHSRLSTDLQFMQQVVTGHIISDVNYDVETLLQLTQLTAMSRQSINIRTYNNELYLEHGRVRAKVMETDLGVTNGIVHVIDSVLFLDSLSVWDTLTNTTVLSQMQDLIELFPDIVAILSDNSRHVTVFLVQNEAMSRAEQHLSDLLQMSRDRVYNATLGHISRNSLTSYNITSPVTLHTLAGLPLTVTRNVETGDLHVRGSHVTAHVTVRNIWCSNGVIFIIDDILHLPTRTVGEEIRRRPELIYMTTLLQTFHDKAYNLSDPTRDFTVFMADNDAFSHLPWPYVTMLLTNIDRTTMILRAHVVAGEKRYLSEIREGEQLQALNNVIYVVTKHGKRYVINNNLWAEVVTSDIPAVNGRVHIINRLLFIAYKSVNYLLQSLQELRPFHDLMSEYPEYRAAVEAEDRNVTLFIPSSRYLRTVTSSQMRRMREDLNVLKRLYQGHTLPQVRMDDVFLRQFPDQTIVSKSSFNVTFKIERSSDGVFVDGGYDRQILDVIGRAYGCTNGVIYVMDGFLNYSPLTILQRLKREPSVSRSLEHMLQLPPPSDAELLNAYNMTFTFLMPDDLAIDFLTLSDLSNLHNMKQTERQKVFWRHVLNGSEITYEELRHGHLDRSMLSSGLSLEKLNSGLYFRYGDDVISRVTRWNLVACNGVIHLLTHYLYQPPPSPTLHHSYTTTHPHTPAVLTGGVARVRSGITVWVWVWVGVLVVLGCWREVL